MLEASVAAALLLLAGFALRATVPLLRTLFIPASVTGGIVGFVALRLWPRIGEEAATHAAELSAELRTWPGFLIAVVFAGLLLEKPADGIGNSLRGAALAGTYAWLVILGQIAIGLAATWLVIAPALDVPVSFGQLLEAGFAGGHGTAAAIGTVYAEGVVQFPEGLDLALFVATFGLVYSVVSGIVLVNIGVRRGWTRADEVDLRPRRESGRPIPPVRFGSLAVQAVLLAAALGLGWLMQRLVGLAEVAYVNRAATVPVRAAGRARASQDAGARRP